MLTMPPRHQGGGKWGALLEAVADGKTVYVPGYRAEQVIGSLKRPFIKKQGFVIRSRSHKEGGVVVWMERR